MKLTLILTFFCILLSLAIYLILAFSIGSISSFGILASLLTPVIVAPPVCILLLKLTHSLDRAQEEILRSQTELEARVVERTQELSRTNEQLKNEIQLRKQAEQNLRENEERLSKVTENVPGMIYQFLLRPDGSSCFPYVNTWCQEIFGISPAILFTNAVPLIDCILPEDRAGFDASVACSAQTLEVWRWEGRLRSSTDKVIWSQGIAKPEQQADGSILWSGILFDVTERKQADEALRTSETFLRTIIDNSPISMWVSDEMGTLIRMNQACRDLLQVTDEDLVGKYNILTDNIVEQQGRMPLVKRVFEKGESVRFTLRYDSAQLQPIRLGKTTQVILEVTISPVLDLQGHLVHAIIQHLDITERKQAEESLKESEERFKEMVNLLPQAFCEIDLKGRLTFANKSAFTAFGYTNEEIDEGINVAQVIIQEDYERAMVNIQKVLGGEDMGGIEYTAVTKGGGTFPVLVYSNPIIKDNQPLGIRTILINIAERNQADKSLRASEDKLRSIFRASPVGIGVVSERVIIEANDRLCAMTGYSHEELIGQSSRILYPDVEEFNFVGSEKYRQIAETGTGTVETRWQMKNGKIIHILLSSSPFDSADMSRGVTFTALDITERKRAEEEKNNLQDQLAQAQKMESVGRLAGGVAHDFNNMLSVIIGYTELALLQTDSNQPLHGKLQEIRKAAERSGDLTQQLLAFARKQTIAPKVLNLNEIVDGMLKMLRRLIGEDIDLAWLPDSDLWQIKIDPAQVDQILANILINARDAIAGVGKITIETENAEYDEAYCAMHAGFMPGEYVKLAVSDTGCGMERETLTHIFEPFFTTKETGKGTGLGMATVYGIVKQNNGFINVYSEPSKGTTFKICLPRYAGKTAAASSEGPTEAIKGGLETVLVVEDEPSILKLGKTILEGLGYKVLAAATPGEAILLAEKHAGDIHLLMTDVVMPEMNGRDLAERLSSLYPSLKCLFMSGYTANVIAHHGILDEGVHFIQKPFSIKNLAAKVREVLDQK
jgi:two-component system, cell cycle sensor histidine kinase and response regulator CckA